MSMTDDQRRGIAQIAQEVIRSQRSLRVPVRKPGTVISSALPGDPVTVLVTGDAATIAATNATGQSLGVGARVVVTFEPPHNVFVTELFRAGSWIEWAPVVTDASGDEPGTYTATGYYTIVGATAFWRLAVTLTTLSPAGAEPLRFTWPLPASVTDATHAGAGRVGASTSILVFVSSTSTAVIVGANMANGQLWNLSGFYELAT